jgi:hypothetical protein
MQTHINMTEMMHLSSTRATLKKKKVKLKDYDNIFLRCDAMQSADNTM